MEWDNIYVCKWCLTKRHPSTEPLTVPAERFAPPIIRQLEIEGEVCTFIGSSAMADLAVVGCSVVGNELDEIQLLLYG